MHYPPEAHAVLRLDQYGAAPHTDYGFITFLAQGRPRRPGGARKGRPVDSRALPVAHTFVVNVADMLAPLEQRPLAVRPRTVCATSRAATATPYRSSGIPASTARLPASRPVAVPDEPPRHERVRYGDYVVERLDRNYAYRRRSS